jgi:hypothetical protein
MAPKTLSRYDSKWPEAKLFSFILDLFLTKCTVLELYLYLKKMLIKAIFNQFCVVFLWPAGSHI